MHQEVVSCIPDTTQHADYRKIVLTHVVYELVRKGALPAIEGKHCLNIGPSSSGLDGLVLHQFQPASIDAVEINRDHFNCLHRLNAYLAQQHERYRQGLYRYIFHKDVHAAPSILPQNAYDLIVAFNMHAASMRWEELSPTLGRLLNTRGHLLLSAALPDQTSVYLGHHFESITIWPLSSFLEQHPIVWYGGRGGIFRDRFGFTKPEDQAKGRMDEYIIVAKSMNAGTSSLAPLMDAAGFAPAASTLRTLRSD